MHYLENFTRVQYNAAKALNDYLLETKGQVRLCSFKYHGNYTLMAMVLELLRELSGSNNLGSIIEGGSRVYETSFLIDSKNEAKAVKDFIDELNRQAASNIKNCSIQKFNENNTVLEEHENVKKVDPKGIAECISSLTSVSFEIPISC